MHRPDGDFLAKMKPDLAILRILSRGMAGGRQYLSSYAESGEEFARSQPRRARIFTPLPLDAEPAIL